MARLMSPADAVFMTVEKPTNPMHIGGLNLFTPPVGASAEEVAALFAGTVTRGAAGLASVKDPAIDEWSVDPFFSRRAVRTWTTAGQWAWDDPDDIDLGYHVVAHRLPKPGQIRNLLQLCSELHAQPLDRRRPLWQAHLITGLADGRLAVYFKMHHALGDGMTTQRLLRASLSPDPHHRGDPPPWMAAEFATAAEHDSAKPDSAKPSSAKPDSAKPSSAKPSSPNADSPNADSPNAHSPNTDSPHADSPHADSPNTDSPNADSPHADSPHADSPNAATGRGLADWLDLARAAAGEAAGFVSVLGRTVTAGLHNDGAPISLAAPRSMLNPPALSATRRFAAQSWPMPRIRAVRNAAGVSTNDVVLGMCSGALRRYLSDLSALPDAALIAMVPVALRDNGLLADSGNAVGAVMCTLATDEADPVQRLDRIHRGMTSGKAALSQMTSTQILAMTALSMGPLLFEPLLARIAGSRPPFNLIISTVPGPRSALYFNGARLDGMYPLSIPLDGQALNITCTTYADQLSFGLTGCARTVPHLQRLLAYLESTLTELEEALLTG